MTGPVNPFSGFLRAAASPLVDTGASGRSFSDLLNRGNGSHQAASFDELGVFGRTGTIKAPKTSKSTTLYPSRTMPDKAAHDEPHATSMAGSAQSEDHGQCRTASSPRPVPPHDADQTLQRAAASRTDPMLRALPGNVVLPEAVATNEPDGDAPRRPFAAFTPPRSTEAQLTMHITGPVAQIVVRAKGLSDTETAQLQSRIEAELKNSNLSLSSFTLNGKDETGDISKVEETNGDF